VCKSVELKIRGMGTQQVRDELKALAALLGSHLPVVQLDSDTVSTQVPQQAWFIGTEYAMPRIPWHTIGAVVVMNADALLLQANYRASEQTYARLVDFLYRLQSTKGTLIAQTYSPNHPLFTALFRQNPALFFDEELKTRTALSYPPATFVVRMEGTSLQTIGARLQAFIKEKGLNIRVEGPYGQAGLLLRFNPKNVQLELSTINELIPVEWKVDPNPIANLS
jgi:primosomal protein N' (replication factor Y)